jgi:FkbM family methyltransferase
MSHSREIDSVVLHLAGRSLPIRGYRGEYLFEQIRKTENFYERDLLDLLHSLSLSPGSIVDVGANLGNHTVFFATAFPKHDVVAVEPFESNVELLRENVRGNGLSDRVSVESIALSDAEGLVGLVEGIAGNLGSMRVKTDPVSNPRYQARRLDDLVDGGPVALIKVDVEGHEAAVLRGGIETIKRCRPVIVAEAHEPEQLREIEAVLAPLDYVATAIRGRSRNYVWIPTGAESGVSPHTSERVSIETLSTIRREIAQGFEVVYRRLGNAGIVERAEPSVPFSAEKVAREIETAVARHVFTSRLGAEDVRGELARTNDVLETLLERTQAQKQAESAMQALVASLDSFQQRYEAAEAGRATQYEKDASAWRTAYERLSRLTATVAPDVWAPDSTEEPSAPRGPDDGAREVTPNVDRDSVRIGIATMPGRELGLAKVLASLHHQADEIFVYLNGYDAPPSAVPAYDNVRYFTGPDLGDRGKFTFLDGFQGYYLTCDDDIEYPRFYVAHLIAGIERYGRRAAVGWHGSVFKEPFTNYYSAESRRVYAYYSGRPEDTPVHLLGTGATGFHTSSIDFSMDDMPVANMADVWLAIRAREQSVPLIVLSHERGWATAIDRDAPSISNSSLGRHDAGQLDMREFVTAEVANRSPWPSPDLISPSQPSALRLGIVGRVDRDRWKKGGILKSSHLTADALRRFGAQVHLEDIETGDPFGFGGWDPNVVLVYVGDPERPDFARVEQCIESHGAKGRRVIVNMSLEGSGKRTEAIRDWMTRWEDRHPGQVHLMVFSNAARASEEFSGFKDRVLVLPKTIEELPPPRATFSTSAGVFVGDIAKLSDPSLIGGDAREWLDAIRRALPGVPLIGVRQYQPRYDVDLELDVVWPFMRQDMASRVSSVRLMTSLVSRATFEMVPIEVASAGVPVLYRVMPQSLSEYLSLAGVEVNTPGELGAVIGEIYNNPSVWRSYSLAGRQRARSLHLDATSGHMYVQLLKVLKGAES